MANTIQFLLLIVLIGAIVVLVMKPEYLILSKLYAGEFIRETFSRDKCSEIRSKHPKWFPSPQQISLSRLDVKELGLVDDSYQLTSHATEKNLYDLGYVWMCGLRNSELNKKKLYSSTWKYGQDGNQFLGASNPENIEIYTRLAKAFNRGYVDAQNDRNL